MTTDPMFFGFLSIFLAVIGAVSFAMDNPRLAPVGACFGAFLGLTAAIVSALIQAF